VSFHTVSLCLKFLFINYSTEVYALHITTYLWARYVSISSPTLIPTRTNVNVSGNQNSCLAQSRTVFSSAKNLRNTVIPRGKATFGTTLDNLWLT
jgi:hypothetical protein